MGRRPLHCSVYLFSLLGFCFLCLPAESAHGQPQIKRILLGQQTDDFPSVGIVGSLRRGGFCSGTLISPTHVLTAAHCAQVIESPTSGTFELGDQIYQTSDLLIHPDYDPQTLVNDIAILQLDEPVLDVEPSEIFRDEPMVGDLLFIVGFGETGTADAGSDGTFGIKRVGMTTIDEVSEKLVNWVFDDESEANTVAGDSGGPGFLEIGGDLFVVSVTSGGTEPDSMLGDFAFNTRVDAFADWIDLTIAVTEQPPSIDPPPTDSPQDDQNDCEGFWAQPFPLLQLLIHFLTALLDALNQAFPQTDDGVVEPPVETPADTPQGELVDVPAATPTAEPAPQGGQSEPPAAGAGTSAAHWAHRAGPRGNRMPVWSTRTSRYSRR